MAENKNKLMLSKFLIDFKVIFNHLGKLFNCFFFNHNNRLVEPVYKYNELAGVAHG